jgi:hypothetical protein
MRETAPPSWPAPAVGTRLASSSNENETVNVQKPSKRPLAPSAFNAKVQEGKTGADSYSDSLIAAAKAAGLSQIEMLNLTNALDDAHDGTLDNRVAMGQLDEKWRNGIETATALNSAVGGIDTANKNAAASAAFWGQRCRRLRR